MAKLNTDLLKSYFETGDIPTQAQFSAAIDSMYDSSGENYLIVGDGIDFNHSTGLLSVNGTLYVTTREGQLHVVNGGTGVNTDEVTDFPTWESGGIAMIYVDLNLTTPGDVTLQKSNFNSTMWHNPPDGNIERFILGLSYKLGLNYYFNSKHLSQYLSSQKINEFQSIIDDLKLNVSEFLSQGNNSTMDTPNDWAVQLGTPDLDFSSLSGKMLLTFTSGNENVILSNVISVGEKYEYSLKCRFTSGTPFPLKIGAFESIVSPSSAVINPTTSELTFTGEITGHAIIDSFSIGALDENNIGGTIEVDDFFLFKTSVYDKIQDERLLKLEDNQENLENHPNSYNTEYFLSSISQFEKPLTKIAILGDSLMGNAVGGVVPVLEDEGLTNRPFRMGYNNIPRRIYDLIKFNAPNYRRIDNTDWSKGGTWVSFLDTTVVEPVHANETYHRSNTIGDYVEILIPDGQENFAFQCQKYFNAGVLNVTLNGGSIAAYGSSTIDLSTTSNGAGDIGNAFYIEEYFGLPAGVNTIRLTKADANETRVWGGFYWSGNTLIVQNIAHGGHAMTNLLTQHIDHELVDNNFDAVLFEITIMNEHSKNRTLAQSLTDLQNIIEDKIGNKDVMVMTTIPFGDNGGGTNFYANYADPDMEDFANTYLPYLYVKGVPYLDVLRVFKKKIENRGGTLTGGEGGLFYTDDGQHPNENGCREWFNVLKPHLIKKPFNV